VRGLACVLVLAGAVNNVRQFSRAAGAARILAAERVERPAVTKAP
jgi:hypothetical protein